MDGRRTCLRFGPQLAPRSSSGPFRTNKQFKCPPAAFFSLPAKSRRLFCYAPHRSFLGRLVRIDFSSELHTVCIVENNRVLLAALYNNLIPIGRSFRIVQTCSCQPVELRHDPGDLVRIGNRPQRGRLVSRGFGHDVDSGDLHLQWKFRSVGATVAPPSDRPPIAFP